MNCPEAVRKHDGRVVAYETVKAANSITKAALACEAACDPEAAKKLGQTLAMAVAVSLASGGGPVPATADVRSAIIKLLRQAKQDAVLRSYTEYARVATGLLWRIRVVEPGEAGGAQAGAPWDRRRLLEALCASGIARDPAGDAAREVERQIVALGRERISPALIHSLTALVLSQRGLEVRNYSARRLGFSLAAQTPYFDSTSGHSLPAPGPALEAFWLQAVHSPAVARAVSDNVLSLEPYPQYSADASGCFRGVCARDLLSSEQSAPGGFSAEQSSPRNSGSPAALRADGAERLAIVARRLALLSPGAGRAQAQQIDVFFSPPPAARLRQIRRAAPVSVNLAGLLVREALRDQPRAAVRLAQSVGLAAQAHREREEYFKLSPVRGRQLPVAVAGLWNAAAWMQGESLDAPRMTRGARGLAGAWVAVLRGALDTLRQQTGMELSLFGAAPEQATRGFWQRDREFFLRDGITLDANGFYDGGPAVRLMSRMEDLSERVAFARDIAAVFDDPPAVMLDAPLGAEDDAELWRDLLQALADAGVRYLQLIPGGTSRGIKNLLRSIQARLEAYPLFDQVAGRNSGD